MINPLFNPEIRNPVSTQSKTRNIDTMIVKITRGEKRKKKKKKRKLKPTLSIMLINSPSLNKFGGQFASIIVKFDHNSITNFELKRRKAVEFAFTSPEYTNLQRREHSEGWQEWWRVEGWSEERRAMGVMVVREAKCWSWDGNGSGEQKPLSRAKAMN